MKIFLVGLALLIVSCGVPDTLRVRQFHLRDTEAASGDLFIRAEMNKRLHGAVTAAERNLRRGNYYHIRWHGLSGAKPVRLVFEYRQVRTGATVKRLEKMIPALKLSDCQIAIGGEEYLKNGRVLAWRVRLYDGKDLVAKKQSYLWN